MQVEKPGKIPRGGGVWQAPPGMENPGDGVQRVWIFSGTTQ